MTSPMDIAATMLGRGEAPDRATLQEFMRNGGANLDPVTTAWCAAFVNASLGQAGIEGTGSNLARSFLDFGEAVDEPQRGDIAVFSRGDPKGWQGHVGFFDSLNPDGTVRVLGGNQKDAVNYSNYPADRLLGYRRPAPPLSPPREIQDRPIAPMQASGQGGQMPAAPGGAGSEGQGSDFGSVLAALAPVPTGQGASPTPQQPAGVQFGGTGHEIEAAMGAAESAKRAKGLASGMMPDVAALMGMGKRV